MIAAGEIRRDIIAPSFEGCINILAVHLSTPQGQQIAKVGCQSTRGSLRSQANPWNKKVSMNLKNACICIVDDDENVCRLLSTFVSSWGLRPEVVTGERLETQWFSDFHADVYLVDLQLPKVTGLDLIPSILKQSSDSKIIIITGFADKEAAINALRLGAFDFLEKPFERELLRHTIERALETLEKERMLTRLVAELRQSQSELLAHKERLEYVNERLLETNRAFSTLARSIDFEREQLEKQVASKIELILLPIIEALRKEKELVKFALELDMLTITLREMASGTSNDPKVALILSPTELRVASLIRGGFSTEEIAGQLFISQNTVRTHRRNIRRKLKLGGAGQNLRSYLLSKSPSGVTEGGVSGKQDSEFR